MAYSSNNLLPVHNYYSFFTKNILELTNFTIIRWGHRSFHGEFHTVTSMQTVSTLSRQCGCCLLSLGHLTNKRARASLCTLLGAVCLPSALAHQVAANIMYIRSAIEPHAQGLLMIFIHIVK